MSIVADNLVKIEHPDSEVCKCPCHEEGQHIMHIAACCQQCKHCGVNIMFWAIANHEAQCFKNPDFGKDPKKRR